MPWRNSFHSCSVYIVSVYLLQYWYEGNEMGDLPVDFSIVWDGDFPIDKPSALKGISCCFITCAQEFKALIEKSLQQQNRTVATEAFHNNIISG